MMSLAVGLIAVPLLDQAIKLLLRRALGQRSHSLGGLGEVRMWQHGIWMARLGSRLRPATMWTLWIAATAALFIVGVHLPSSHSSIGLLLGGSLSHALEMSRRGSISDYVCLRFWPAFDLADVALAAGACGMLVSLAAAAAGGLRP